VLTMVGAVSPEPINVRIRGSAGRLALTPTVCPEGVVWGKPTSKLDVSADK
jgi:hypothetical protein